LIGMEVDIIAERSAYNGLEQLSLLEVEELDEGTMPAPRSITNVPFTETDLLPYQAQLVSAEGLEVIDKEMDQYDNIILTLANEDDEEIGMRWDSRLEDADTSSIEEVEVGDFINLVAAPLSWYNGPRLYYTDPSQITEAEYIPQTDEERVVAAMDTLDIPTEIGEDTTLSLPVEGPYGVSIEWASDNAAIDAETGEVTVTGEAVDVELTATLSLNEVEEVALFLVTVGYISVPVYEAREAELETTVTVQAVITAVSIDNDGEAVAFVQDETAGIYLYKVPAEFEDHMVVGNQVQVTGLRGAYADGIQLVDINDVRLLEEDVDFEPVVVEDPAELADVQGEFVSVTGLLAETYSGNPSDYQLVTEMGTFALRLVSDSDAPADQRDAVIDALVGVDAGTEITIEAGAGRFYGTFQIMLFNDSMITVGDMASEEDLLAAALGAAGVPEDGSETDMDLDLPTEGYFGTEFAWESDNEDVITNEGDVTRPGYDEEDAVVTLSLTVTIDEEVVHEEDIEITVLAGEMEISTIAEARDMSEGTVRVQGVITAQLDHGTYLIQDDTSGLGIYDFDFGLGELIGKEVDIIAGRGSYNGLEQLNLIEVEELGEGEMPDPQSIDGVSFSDLLPFQAQLVSAEGLEVVDKEIDGYENIILTLANEDDEEIGMRWDSRLGGTDTSAIEAVEVGDFIDLVGAPLSWSNGPRLYYTDPSQIEDYEFPETSVAFARDADEGTEVTTEAVVTAVSFDTDGEAVAFVQDSTAGIYLYKVPAEFEDHLVVGNMLEITGELGAYADITQIVDITDVQLLEEDVDFEPVVVEDPAELADVQGQFVSVTGFLAETYSGNPSDYQLVTEMGTFALRLVSDSDAPADQRNAVIDALVGVDAGTEITIEAGAGRYYGTFQVMLFHDTMITVGDMGTPEQLEPVILADLTLPEENDEVTSDLSLPTEGLFGSTITWESDDEDVISTTGTVNRPEEDDATVVLTYTVEIGDELIVEKDITVTVLADSDPVEPDPDLFFSEYIDGSSNNKALEIYNPTDEEVDLTPYVVELYSNGRLEEDGPTNSLDLEGTLAPGEVFVIVNFQASEEFRVGDYVESDVTYYNGNDALVLRNDGEIIDSFGKLGEDPGTSWSANGVSTADVTLVRKSSVQSGRTDATSEFDPSLEWIEYDQDTSEYLGSHDMDS
ncbi:MAG: immunoglobulin-like domain-containing protein, partial [Acholeplasmataceae bacterium]